MVAFLDLIDEYEDKKRFEQLYYRYRGLMAHIALAKVGTQEDAEDVLQEAFLYIAKHFEKIGEINANSTKRFIAVITEGYAIKKYKSEKRHAHTDEEEAEFNKAAEDFDLGIFDKIELMAAIDELPDEYRNLLYMAYIFGYTSKELADMFKIPETSVRKRIQYAKCRVRENLKGEMKNG